MDEVILTIPVDDENNVFECINIEDMTGEEFIQWIKFVYPGGILEEEPEIFEDLDNRQRIYEIILSFWMNWVTPGTKEPPTFVKEK